MRAVTVDRAGALEEIAFAVGARTRTVIAAVVAEARMAY
jgi:hypothetical protein